MPSWQILVEKGGYCGRNSTVDIRKRPHRDLRVRRRAGLKAEFESYWVLGVTVGHRCTGCCFVSSHHPMSGMAGDAV